MRKNSSIIIDAEEKRLGHPDRLADSLAWILCSVLSDLDSAARFDMQTTVHFGPIAIFENGDKTTLSNRPQVSVSGQINTSVELEVVENAFYAEIARHLSAIDYGYKIPALQNFRVTISLQPQSSDIHESIVKGRRGGFGDATIATGYASNQTAELLSVPHALVRRIVQHLDLAQARWQINGLLADGKVQAHFIDRQVEQIVVAAQHADGIDVAKFKVNVASLVREAIVSLVTPLGRKVGAVGDRTQVWVNNGSAFSIGGSMADTGVSGRMDSQHHSGAILPDGGGLVVGRDGSKTDFSLSLLARLVAKTIVVAEIASEAIVTFSCGIGNPDTLRLSVTAKDSKYSNRDISSAVRETFDLTPNGVGEQLQIKPTTFRLMAQNGLVGAPHLPSERIDEAKLELLRKRLPPRLKAAVRVTADLNGAAKVPNHS